MKAARQEFEANGYVDARVQDITARAGMGQGSFYDYFSSKEEVFRIIATNLADEMRTAANQTLIAADPVVRVREVTRAYLDAYRQNAKMLAILEQVATISDEFRTLRLEIRNVNVERIEGAIRRWQSAGICPADLDPKCSASALASMIGNFAYLWLGVGEEHDEETALDTLTILWTRGLGIRVKGAPEAPQLSQAITQGEA